MTKIIVMMLLVFTGCGLGHPSEAALIEKFSQNKTDFYRLVEMLNEDPDIRRISNEHVFYDTESDSVSHERIELYRQILKRLEIKDGIHRVNSRSISFIASSRGPFLDASYKAYIYSTETPVPLVDSIDEFVSYRKQKPVYKRLEDNWYLAYESW